MRGSASLVRYWSSPLNSLRKPENKLGQSLRFGGEDTRGQRWEGA
jgi:hypothetical protein